jgi:tetratricopeptide (TPR) repeat protein
MADEEKNVSLTESTKETIKKIAKYLNSTLWLGVPIGLMGICGYTLITDGWKFMFFSILLAAGAYITGFFLGFLFGIPKKINEEKSGYLLNTNLVDISDWLTKIIIGLGLVELKKIPSYLQSVGDYIQQATNIKDENSVHVFAISCIVYFSIFGLYYGYCYMRLFLSIQFRIADDFVTKGKDELLKKGEKLNEQIINPNKIDDSVKKELNEYNQQLRIVKTEAEYTFDDWYLKGISAYDKNEYEKTIANMKNALQKDMKHKKVPDAHLYIGLAYDDLGLSVKAIEQLNKIISDYPSYSQMELVHFNKGVILYNLKHYRDSLKEYDKAIKIKNNDSGFWSNKASALYELERYEEALLSYNKAIELNPEDSEAWGEKGDVLNILERYKEALEACNKAIKIDSENSDAWASKVEAMIDLEQYKEVLPVCDNAIKLNPDDENLWFNKGYALISLKRYKDALEPFDKAIELKVDDAYTWYNKACCYSMLEDKDNMLASLTKAIQLENESKNDAAKDEEFKRYWEDTDFKKLIE